MNRLMLLLLSACLNGSAWSQPAPVAPRTGQSCSLAPSAAVYAVLASLPPDSAREFSATIQHYKMNSHTTLAGERVRQLMAQYTAVPADSLRLEAYEVMFSKTEDYPIPRLTPEGDGFQIAASKLSKDSTHVVVWNLTFGQPPRELLNVRIRPRDLYLVPIKIGDQDCILGFNAWDITKISDDQRIKEERPFMIDCVTWDQRMPGRLFPRPTASTTSARE